MSAAHTDALPQVLAFARRFGEQHAALAMHAAVPLGLTPELVHLLRVNFVRAAEWIAEADLLLSPLCHEAGAELYEMDPAVRQLLLDELQQDADFGRSRRREVVAFLEVYARQAQPGASREMRDFLQALLWGARAEIDPASTARELAEALKAGAGADDPAEMVRIADVTDALSAPLLEERGLLLYTAELRRRASDFAPAFDSTGEATIVQGVALPALVAASTSRGEPAGSEEPKTLFTMEEAPVIPGAVYLSYAREDHEAALRVRDQLQAARITVWMDETLLKPGDDWQAKLDRALQECSLFMPLLSKHTAERPEGLFRREWNLALERRSRFSRERTFIVPIVVSEDFSVVSHDVPKGLSDIYWTHAPHGQLPPSLLERIRDLLRQSSSEPVEQPKQEPAHWILIAGLGSHNLPPHLAEITEALGKVLARAGYGLVGGGWPGVDHVAARAFGAEVRAMGRAEDRWLRQFVRRTQKASYPGGRIEHVTDEWGALVEHADAVILLSGSGGTRRLGEIGHAGGKPVLPLAVTGGDAADLWKKIADEWETNPVRGLTMNDFARIGASNPAPLEAVISLLAKALNNEGNGGLEGLETFRPVGPEAA